MRRGHAIDSRKGRGQRAALVKHVRWGYKTHSRLVSFDAMCVVIDSLVIVDDWLDIVSANEDSEASLVSDPIGTTARERGLCILARGHAAWS